MSTQLKYNGIMNLGS